MKPELAALTERLTAVIKEAKEREHEAERRAYAERATFERRLEASAAAAADALRFAVASGWPGAVQIAPMLIAAGAVPDAATAAHLAALRQAQTLAQALPPAAPGRSRRL